MGVFQSMLHRIPKSYFARIPAIYFLLLGMFDIGMDLWAETFTWSFVLFNAVFFLPLIFPKRKLYLVFGICSSVFWSYLLIGGGLFVMPGNPRISTLQAIGVSFFLLFSLLCSLSLVYAGADYCREHGMSRHG